MKNMSISKKLLVSYGVVLILMVAIIGLSIFSLRSVSSGLEEFYNEPYQLTSSVLKIKATMQECAKNLLYACVSTDEDQTEERLGMASDGLSELDSLVQGVESKYDGNSSDLTGIEDGIQKVRDAYDAFQPLCTANNIEGAFKVYQEQIQPELLEINTYVENVQNFEDQTAESTYEDGVQLSQSSSVMMVIEGVVAVAIAVVMGIYISRLLVNCVNELKGAALQMSGGNFDVSIAYESKDELGELSNSMRTMNENIQAVIGDLDYVLSEMSNGNFAVHTRAEASYVGMFETIKLSLRKMRLNLNEVLNQIDTSSEQVSGSSDQVAAGAQALSQGSTEQAASVEELAATLNDVSNQIQATAENATNAKEHATTAGREINVCNKQMGDMIEAMNEISQKSSEIGKIIKAIEDIAFQTNILALNAAVEAARAGAAGKGFAVVADEVGNLANKSAEASKDTSQLIEGAVRAVENGTSIASKTAELLMTVVDTSEATTKLVDQIANAANEQSVSIAQISEGLDQISSVVQTNSATSEESAATSEELSSQAQVLKSLIQKFQLEA